MCHYAREVIIFNEIVEFRNAAWIWSKSVEVSEHFIESHEHFLQRVK